MESILAALATIAVGAFALWGAMWKAKAHRRQAELDQIYRASDSQAELAAKRLEKTRLKAANENPIDPENRDAFQ